MKRTNSVHSSIMVQNLNVCIKTVGKVLDIFSFQTNS